MQRDPSAMTPAELWCLRKFDLGLTIAELGTVLGLDARDAPPDPNREPALARSTRKREPLSERTVRRWESRGRDGGLSASNAEALARLITYTDQAVAAIVAAHQPGEPIFTYTNDDELHRAEPDLWPSLPALWHNAVAHRAAQQIPGATITYSS